MSQSCPILSANCSIIYVCFVYFAAIAQVWINLHRQNVFYTVMLPSPTGTARTKKKQRRKRQSRSWRFSFHKHFTAVFYLFPFFNYFTLSFFSILFLPTTLTHTHTHDPRPTTFSYTRKRCSALSVRMRLFKLDWNMKSSSNGSAVCWNI